MSDSIVEWDREPKYPPIKDGDEVAYLILLVSVPVLRWSAPADELGGVESAQKAGEILGVKIWPMRLTWSKRAGGEYRYFFRFPHFRRDDQRAQQLAECFLYALSLTVGPCVDRDEEAVVFRAPADLVRRRRMVARDQLVQVEEARPYDTRTLGFPGHAFGSACSAPAELYDAAWRITPVLVHNHGLHRAVRFLKASQDDFYIWPGEVPDVLANPTATASTGFRQTALESALHNAFKAVEAILGDPPKDDAKLRAKMIAAGLEPDAQVGYREKTAFSAAIRSIGRARDKKTAHGSTCPGMITVGELMGHQACARLVVWTAIEHALGEPIFP